MRLRNLLVAATFAAAPTVMAGEVMVDLAGVDSVEALGNGNNFVLSIDLGAANAEVTGIAWDLLYTPIVPSWTSEPNLQYSDSAQTDIYNWDMGDWGGVDDSEPIALAGSDVTSFFVGGDGLLRIEFWEDFVDFANAPDGTYDRGMLTISYVPAPSCLALLGLGGLVGTRRRRA